MSPSFTARACRPTTVAAFLGILLLCAASAWIASASEAESRDTGGIVHASGLRYPSDARLMENSAALESGLATVLQLSPVSFKWKDGPRKGDHDIGFIAQDVESVVPQVVYTDESGMKYVDYAKMLPVLIRAVQEQQAELDLLQAGLTELSTD